jgi:hypothetical protein
LGWLEYVDKTNNYKISYPEGWTQQKNEGLVAILAPKENEADKFQENVNIIAQDISSSPMSLAEFTKLSMDQYATMQDAVEILTQADTKLAGYPAHTLTLTLDYGGTLLKLKQIWLVKKNTAIILTYTAHHTQYTAYEAVADKIMGSFEFLK